MNSDKQQSSNGNDIRTSRLRNPFLNRSSNVISLGGFLFGYDTGVINGALLFLSTKQQLNLDSTMQGIVSSSLVLGCMFGALINIRIADYFGRKRTLQGFSLIFALGALASAAAQTPLFLIISRFILGISVGCMSGLVPIYLNEISPQPFKTITENKNNISVIFGQLSAFTMNAILGTIFSDWQPIWRVMMGVAAIPALFLLMQSVHLPYSPNWQLLKGQKDEGLKTFKRLGFLKTEIDYYIHHSEKSKMQQKETILSWSKIFKSRKLIYLLIVGISIGAIQQLSGINTVMYYGTLLLKKVGMGTRSSLFGNVLIGLVSAFAVLWSTRLTTKFNYRSLLIVGLAGNMLCHAMIVIVLKSTLLSKAAAMSGVLILLILFLAIQQGIVSPVTWLFLAEIFPLSVRGKFMSLSTTSVWLTNFIVSLFFPIILSQWGTANAFLLFVITNAVCLLLTVILIREKKLTNIYHDFS